MKSYVVVADAVKINEGQIIKLTDEQLKNRKFLVKRVKGKNLYECIIAFHLKCGEIFETDIEVNKKLGTEVQEKEVFDSLEFREKMNLYSKNKLLKYASKNCSELKLDSKNKKEFILDSIVKHSSTVVHENA